MRFKLVSKELLDEDFSKYRKLDESTLNRLIKGHDKDGYVIISASRGDKTPSENNKRFDELKEKVWSLGYSYVPVFGGYKEDDFGEVLEKSLFVLPKNKRSGDIDLEKFFSDMKELGKEYEQDSVLVKYPDENPRYLELSTGRLSAPFDGELLLNDVTQ